MVVTTLPTSKKGMLTKERKENTAVSSQERRFGSKHEWIAKTKTKTFASGNNVYIYLQQRLLKLKRSSFLQKTQEKRSLRQRRTWTEGKKVR